MPGQQSEGGPTRTWFIKRSLSNHIDWESHIIRLWFRWVDMKKNEVGIQRIKRVKSYLAIFVSSEWKSYWASKECSTFLYQLPNCHRWNAEFKIHTTSAISSSENNSTQTISGNIMISSAAFNLANPQLESVIACEHCELCQLLQIRRSPCRSWSIIFINYSDIWNVTQSY